MSLSQGLLKSSSFLFLGRLFNRSIGLVSTLVLARILTPEDFGIVAIASIVVFFFDAMSQVGIREYLTQKEALTDADINTAWTLNAIVKLVFWIGFVVSIPWIADFYEDQKLVPVLLVVSLILPLLSFESVGLILLQRDLNYKPLFKLQVMQKIVGFGVMLTLLFVLKSYWVMILSLVTGYVVRLVGSYVVAWYRPCFCLSQFSEQWEFSKWILPKGAIGFVKSELDTIIVSKLFGLASLGGFNLMKSLVSMIGRDVIQPATEPLLAAFSKNKSDREALGFQVKMSFWIVSAVILPVVVYTFSFSDLVVSVLYGEQWLGFSNVLKVLSPLIYIFATTGIFWNVLMSQAKVRELFYVEILALVVTATFLLSLPLVSLDEFSLVRTVVAIAFWCLIFSYVRLIAPFSIGSLLVLSLPICFSVLLATFVAKQFVLLNVAAVFSFLLTGAIFVTLYSVLLFCLLIPLRKKSEVIYLRWFIRKQFRIAS